MGARRTTSTTPLPDQPVRGSRSGQPLMAALDLLGRRWSLRVLWELHDGPIGFRALQAACDSMSSSVLSARLGELVEAGLVVRVDDDYAYSPIGVELATALAPLSDWSRRWRDTLSRRPTTT